MNKLSWWFTRRWERFPLLDVLSWGTVLIVLWLVVGVLMPTHQQILERQSSMLVTVDEEPVVEQNRQADGSTLLRLAPEVESVSGAINTLFLLAGKHRLNVTEVNYQEQQKPGEPILPYNIDFDVEASYPAVKSFLTELLAALPYLALQQIRFERETINEKAVNVQLKLSLYLNHE